MINTECVPKKVVTGEIVSKIQVATGHYLVGVLCPYIARNSKPGQFILVRVSASYDPLLSRPLAVYRSKGDVFEMMFRIVGKGTSLLAEKNVGDSIGIVGPLGNCFPMDDDFQTAIFVAGGMGVAALMSLAEAFKGRRVISLIGAATSDKIIGDKDLAELGAEVHIATEDGSAGYKGKVTGLLLEFLEKLKHLNDCRIFACGPMPMLKVIYVIAKRYNIPVYVSLEERMACGVGACMGCVCKTSSPDGKAKYKTVCSDGPIFNAQEIAWE